MNFRNSKKFGFTLMEIVIAVFIVALLTILTVPIITRQLEKADEYSYYLAYRTVEQMAGQIVSLGDPKELTLKDLNGLKVAQNSNNDITFKEYLANKLDLKTKSNSVKKFIAFLGDRFVYAEAFIFKKLFPAVIAGDTVTVEEPGVVSWDSSLYDELWLAYRVCNGYTVKKAETSTTNPDGTTSTITTNYTKEDFNNCIGYTASAQLVENDVVVNTIEPHSELKSFLLSGTVCNENTSAIASAASFIASQEHPNASAFCSSSAFKKVCVNGGSSTIVQDGITKKLTHYFQEGEDRFDGDDSEDLDDGSGDDAGENTGTGVDGFVEPEHSSPAGTCIVDAEYDIDVSSPGSSDNPPERETFPANYCDNHGYLNMTNEAAPDSVACVCKNGYMMSLNNDRACVLPCATQGEVPYVNNLNQTICCPNDFDPGYNGGRGRCCPEHSAYTGSSCDCTEGYTMNSAGICEPDGTCTKGSTWNAEYKVCVVNPPIIKANRFCERITEFWNISSSSCGNWSTTEGIQYNADVYNAAKGENGTLMSIQAKTGAFANITPNITFANGLKMWILSDKSASIPGLSYTPVNASASQNVCRKIDVATHVKCSLQDGYFCKSENSCFTMDNASKAAIRDARTCCGTIDLSDISAAALTTPGLNKDDYLRDPSAYAISGFTVFVDINGDKGNGTLWDDVYPFFIAANGSVYPAYPLDANKQSTGSSSLYIGGNSEKQLPVDVYYYESTNESRIKKIAFPGVSYARGICSARKVSKFAPYCMNLGEKFAMPVVGGTLTGSGYISNDDRNTSLNPCDSHNCYVAVRKKLRSF